LELLVGGIPELLIVG
jgi:putative DNA primase/helicase